MCIALCRQGKLCLQEVCLLQYLTGKTTRNNNNKKKVTGILCVVQAAKNQEEGREGKEKV